MPVLSHNKLAELYPNWWKMDKGSMPNLPRDVFIIVQENNYTPYSVIDNRGEKTYFFDFKTWLNVRAWFHHHGMAFFEERRKENRKHDTIK